MAYYPFCKKPFAHINTAVARQEYVCMAPGVMVTVGKSEKVLWVHMAVSVRPKTIYMLGVM